MQPVLFGATEFDGDELLLMLLSLIACFLGGVQFFKNAQVSKLGSPRLLRLPLYLAFIGSFSLLAYAAKQWTAREVRESDGYIFLVVVMGGGFLALAGNLFRWLGISLREDVFERRSFAAVVALSGAVVGVMLIYTGANMGEGPSFWNNVFGAILGIGTLFGLWVLMALGGGVVDSIVLERDVATAERFAGFLMASGLILARALAGDWHSALGTVYDFAHDGWPVLVLAFFALLLDPFLRPRESRRSQITGIPIAALYLALAIGWVWHLGLWEGMKR